MKLHIKNMVCDRCKKVIKEEFTKLNITATILQLGEIETDRELEPEEISAVRAMLETNGFELLEDKKKTLIEQIKTLLIEEIQYLKGHKPESVNYSDYLAQKTGYDYAYLSSLFSAEVGQTIEHYIISQKIEKTKEWLSYNELTLSEIAWRLQYSSTAHLSNQFKKITGMTPGAFKKSRVQDRKTLDKVG
ncbi:helix-turn-helix domain-containing protein [Dyadobacter tibetensis]|uniref:helix-turn-helix domain-containing protein n=1 Tax=Dyadobacter tibetensis TaxID=1211851 RepID=UPI0004720D0A|nr:AraC family transcriptional regulator [Dyadobacter tibetensis]